MLKGDLVLIWELDVNLELTLFYMVHLKLWTKFEGKVPKSDM